MNSPTPSAATAVTTAPFSTPVDPRFAWSRQFAASEWSGPNARLSARTRLTMACWQGDVDAASRVLDKLVDNAVKHTVTAGAGTVPVRLYIFESGTLLIEVDDLDPQFADFASVLAGGPTASGSPLGGLWWVQERYKAQLSFYVRTGDDGELLGKTVQALMEPERGRAG